MKRSAWTVVFLAVLILIPLKARAGGTITGSVRYQGEPFLAKRRPITVDAGVCGPEAVSEDLVLGKRGAVRDVVVSLEGAFEGAPSLPKPQEGFTLDEKGCRLLPHVLMVPAGADISILNSDHLNHSFKTYSRTNPILNIPLPKSVSRTSFRIDFPEIVEIRCEVHDWERARIVVVNHPYDAVTDADGRFEIRDIPAGDYTVAFWHESLGSQSRRVQVREGETLRMDLVFGQQSENDFPMEPEASNGVSRLDVVVVPIELPPP